MQNIKSRCTWCNAKIPKTEKHFKTFGNSCKTCSAIFSHLCKGKLKKNGHKDRPFTTKEKEKIMNERRAIVKLNKL